MIPACTRIDRELYFFCNDFPNSMCNCLIFMVKSKYEVDVMSNVIMKMTHIPIDIVFIENEDPKCSVKKHKDD